MEVVDPNAQTLAGAPVAPAAPAAPAAKPAAPKFGERVADLLVQVLPHFHAIRLAADSQARDLSYKFVVAGAADPTLRQAALNAIARVQSFAGAIESVLKDPNLPAEVGSWWQQHVGK